MSIKNFFSNLGIGYKEELVAEIPYDWTTYQLADDLDRIQAHRDFLAKLEDQEEKRLETIESKTSSLISQTAIVFSLLGLFIPILIDKTSEFGLGWKIVIIGLMLLTSICYLLTIHNALKNYDIPKFIYTRSRPQNVLELKDERVELFLAEEVRDLLLAIPKNKHINNRKANHLIHSYFAFRLANILTGCLVAIFASAMLFYTENKETVGIDGPVEIRHLDTLIEKLNEKIKRDTVIVVNDLKLNCDPALQPKTRK